MEQPSTLPEEQILITNTTSLTNKINSFKHNRNQTIIVTDFDYTFSHAYLHPDSKTKLYSSYCFLENSSLITNSNPNFKQELADITNKYAKHERDTSLEFSQRMELVRTWFQLAFELYVKQGFHQQDIYKMVNEIITNNKTDNIKFSFRKGIKEMFEACLHLKIPVIVISGGLKEVIDILLQIYLGDTLYSQLMENKLMIILANSFHYDSSTSIVNGYDNPFIYTFNKSDYVVNSIQNELMLNSKDINIIVIGDHLNDYDSINKCNCDNVIGIGFINYNNYSNKQAFDDLIKQFKSVYDVNIIYNSTFNYVTSLLYKIKE